MRGFIVYGLLIFLLIHKDDAQQWCNPWFKNLFSSSIYPQNFINVHKKIRCLGNLRWNIALFQDFGVFISSCCLLILSVWHLLMIQLFIYKTVTTLILITKYPKSSTSINIIVFSPSIFYHTPIYTNTYFDIIKGKIEYPLTWEWVSSKDK